MYPQIYFLNNFFLHLSLTIFLIFNCFLFEFISALHFNSLNYNFFCNYYLHSKIFPSYIDNLKHSCCFLAWHIIPSFRSLFLRNIYFSKQKYHIFYFSMTHMTHVTKRNRDLEDNINDLKKQPIKMSHSEASAFNSENNVNHNGGEKIMLGTHSGTFHCDEAMGMVLLKYLNRYKDAEIKRSRNMEELKCCEIVIDVGGEYDLEKRRFDHHQKNFEEYFSENRKVTKLSSAGLVYKHYGKQILKEGFSKLLEGKEESLQNDIIETVYPLLYENLIEMIDAIDTGVSISDAPLKYKQTTDLPSRVGALNIYSSDNAEVNKEDSQFEKAMKLCKEDLDRTVEFLVKILYPDRQIVKKAIDNRYKYHPSGKVVVFEKYCMFKEHITTFENENYVTPNELLFCIYPDSASIRLAKKNDPSFDAENSEHILNNPDITWRIQAISHPLSFKSRLPLPEHLRALKDDELVKAANIEGVNDLIFVHFSGFIGGAKSMQSCIKLADLAIKLETS